uniref:Uncharacterized protein n=1 Tax=Rhizophora mucronata TaxID=61149 RepID=A0A2P2LSH6_RHIMU
MNSFLNFLWCRLMLVTDIFLKMFFV